MANELTTQGDDAGLLAVLKSSLYPGAKDESISLVLGYCRAAGLDPLQKPVHIVPMRVKLPRSPNARQGDRDEYEWRDTIMPGIGLYRTQASRTGQLVGIDEPEFGPDVPMPGRPDKTVPAWCRVTVYRMVGGVRSAFTAREIWAENYATANRDSLAPNSMWERRPHGQIAKCAEAQALRKAFPELGSQPTADETVHEPEGPAYADPVAPATPADFGVRSKSTKADDVTDATIVKDPQGEPTKPTKPAAAVLRPKTEGPINSPASERLVGAGEIAYLRNKAASLKVDLDQVLRDEGGLVLEKLSLTDFDRVRSIVLKGPE